MPLARRLPKRGFTNNFKKEFQIVNLEKIESLQVESVNPQILYENGLVRSALKPIKILANGEITKKININGVDFSRSAQEKIEKLGGEISEQ